MSVLDAMAWGKRRRPSDKENNWGFNKRYIRCLGYGTELAGM